MFYRVSSIVRAQTIFRALISFKNCQAHYFQID